MSFYPKRDDRLARLEERLRRGTTVVLVLSKVRAFLAYIWSIHAQSTVIGQGNAPFPAAYSGTNSLFPSYQVRETFSVTGFLGYKAFEGTEFYFNPEPFQGFGQRNPWPCGISES
jgi:hypothetical protein